MEHTHEHHHHHNDSDTVIPADRQATCIVTGDIFDTQAAKEAGYFVEYGGQTYYFCCATCLRLFKADPEKYLSNQSGKSNLTLIERELLIGNVWDFRFKSEKPLDWTAGQFIRVELSHNDPDSEGTKRWFTISSIAEDGYIQITTRITGSSFKQALSTLEPRDTIRLIELPDGDFVWQESEKPLIFIAAGIGITPFYAMLKARVHSGLSAHATLIYNGRDHNLPFKTEFDEASERYPELQVHYLIGQRLSIGAIKSVVPDLESHQVYMSGPEAMVEALSAQTIDSGISKVNLHQDFFPNYTDDNY